MQLRGRDLGSKKKKMEFVPLQLWDKQKVEGRCMKCGKSNHQAQKCKASSRAKTPLFLVYTKQEPVEKKSRFDKGYLKITKLASEEHLGNAYRVYHQSFDILLDTPTS